jgi:hypothetical protein
MSTSCGGRYSLVAFTKAVDPPDLARWLWPAIENWARRGARRPLRSKKMSDTLSTELASSGERTCFQVASVVARLFVPRCKPGQISGETLAQVVTR